MQLFVFFIDSNTRLSSRPKHVECYYQ